MMHSSKQISLHISTGAGVHRKFLVDREECLASIQDQLGVEKPEFYLDGRHLSKFLSLSYQDVKDEDTLIVVGKKRAGSRRARIGNPFRPCRNLESRRRGWSARIDDIVWDGWELSHHYIRMMNVITTRLEDLANKSESAVPKPAVVIKATEIPETPLPVWFKDNGDGRSDVKTDIVW